MKKIKIESSGTASTTTVTSDGVDITNGISRIELSDINPDSVLSATIHFSVHYLALEMSSDEITVMIESNDKEIREILEYVARKKIDGE